MNDAGTLHGAGYLCLMFGIIALCATPAAFRLVVNDYFEREDERQRLEYAVTPVPLRKPWFFAFAKNASKTIWIFRYLMIGFWWFAIVGGLIWGGINMIRHGG